MASRRTRLIAAMAAVVVVVGVAVAIVLARLVGSGGSGPDVSLTVEASNPAGTAPSGADLERTRQLLVARMTAAGLKQPKVDRSGDRRLILHAKGAAGTETLRDLIAPGRLRIRRVLATSDPNAASTPAAPASRSASQSTSQPTEQPTGQATDQPTGQPADPTESGQPNDLASGPRAAVAAKLGPAYAAADRVTSFEQGQALAPNVLQAFAALTPAEVAVLPEQMQLYVPTVSCDALHNRPAEAISQPDTEIVACTGDGQKYLLDDAEVTGRDIRSATVGNNQGLWTVTVALTGDGQQRFTALTRDLATDHGQLAIVVDATILAAPSVLAEIPGDVEISGAFTPGEAKRLAAQLSGGELPVELKPVP